MNRYEFKKRASIDTTPIIVPIGVDGILTGRVAIDSRTQNIFDGPFDHNQIDDVEAAAQAYVNAELGFRDEAPENYVLVVTLSSGIEYGPTWQDYSIHVWFSLTHKLMVVS